MKKRRLKFKPYLLLLGLLWIPCNVFAAGTGSGLGMNSGAPSSEGMNQFAQTTGTELGNIATNLQGQPQSSWPGIIAADVGAMNGVTIDGFGNITVNAWVMGNYAVGPQPAPNLNIYDAGAWKAFNPGQSLMDQYRGGCGAGCPCGDVCGSLSQCTDSCSGHLVMLTEIRYMGTTPVREPGCLTRGGYSIIYGYHYQCIYNGGGTCGINYWYYGQFPVVMKAMGHQDNTDWYYENRYINQEYGGLIRNIYCNRGGPKRCKPDGGPVLLHTGTCENWIYPKVANTYVNPTTSSSNAVNVVQKHIENTTDVYNYDPFKFDETQVSDIVIEASKVLVCGLKDRKYDCLKEEEQWNFEYNPSTDLLCPKSEHVHDEYCYITCTIPEHEHGLMCLNADKTDLICGKAYHEHNIDCCDTTMSITPTCGKQTHLHDKSCFMPSYVQAVKDYYTAIDFSDENNFYHHHAYEGCEVHHHTNGCYEIPKVKKTICNNTNVTHTHTEACYKHICGNTDPSHIHIDECYEWEVKNISYYFILLFLHVFILTKSQFFSHFLTSARLTLPTIERFSFV